MMHHARCSGGSVVTVLFGAQIGRRSAWQYIDFIELGGVKHRRLAPTPYNISATQRDYSLGWRLTRAGSGPGVLELSMEARRREAANPGSAAGAGAAPEQEIGLNFTARF